MKVVMEMVLPKAGYAEKEHGCYLVLHLGLCLEYVFNVAKVYALNKLHLSMLYHSK